MANEIKIAKRISADAKRAMKAKGLSDKICDEYANAVEDKFMKILVQTEYERKCREAALFPEDIDYFINYFYGDAVMLPYIFKDKDMKKQSDILPYFVDGDMVNRATADALKEVKNKYKDEKLEGFSSELKYNTELKKPSLIRPQDEYLLPRSDRVALNIPLVDNSPAYREAHAAEAEQRDKDVAAVKALDFKSPRVESMAPAAKMFDSFVGQTNLFKKYSGVPMINNQYKKTSKDKFGRVTEYEADPTDFFYIEGQTVDKYLSKKIKGYNDYSVKEKQYFAKVAIINAVLTGKNVDMKSYVQDVESKKCNVRVSKIVYDEEAYKALTDKDKQDSKKRGESIKKLNAKTDLEIIDNVNAYELGRKREDATRLRTLQVEYHVQIDEVMKIEAGRRREQKRHEQRVAENKDKELLAAKRAERDNKLEKALKDNGCEHIAANDLSFVAKMYKMYGDKSLSPADVLFGKVKLTDEDYEKATAFLDNCAKSGRSVDILAMEKYSLNAIADMKIEDMEKAAPDYDELKSLQHISTVDLFSNLHKGGDPEYDKLKHSCYAFASTVDMLAERKNDIDYKNSLYADMVYNSLMPSMAGKTMAQLGETDRAKSLYDTYLHHMMHDRFDYDQKFKDPPFETEMFLFTRAEYGEYKNSGKWPKSVHSDVMQHYINELHKETIETINKGRAPQDAIAPFELADGRTKPAQTKNTGKKL